MNQMKDALQAAVEKTVAKVANQVTGQATFNLGKDCRLLVTPGKAIVIDGEDQTVLIDGGKPVNAKLSRYQITKLLTHNF